MKKCNTIQPKNEAETFLKNYDSIEIDAETMTPRKLRYLSRINQTLKIVQSRISPPARVVELACAQANMSLLLAERGYSVVAVDLRPEFLKYAQKKWESGTIEWLVANAEHLPIEDGSVDVVLVPELVEHCAYPERILQEASRIVRSSGFIVVTTPNGEHFKSKLPGYEETRGNADKLALEQFKPDAEGHVLLFRPNELRSLLLKSGLNMSFGSFYGSPFLSDQFLCRVPPKLRTIIGQPLDRLVRRIPGLNRKLCVGLCYGAVPK